MVARVNLEYIREYLTFTYQTTETLFAIKS